MRVLKWMIDRIESQVKGRENVFGISPTYEEITWDGLAFSAAQFESVMHIDKLAWREELQLHDNLFQQLAYHLPPELPATQKAIGLRLDA